MAKGKTYTQQEIINWKTLLENTPSQIKDFNTNITKHEKNIQEIAPNLNAKLSELNIVEEEFQALSARIKILQAQKNITEQQNSISEIKSFIEDGIAKINALKKQLLEVDKEIEVNKIHNQALELESQICLMNHDLATEDLKHKRHLSDASDIAIKITTTKANIASLTNEIEQLLQTNQSSNKNILWLDVHPRGMMQGDASYYDFFHNQERRHQENAVARRKSSLNRLQIDLLSLESQQNAIQLNIKRSQENLQSVRDQIKESQKNLTHIDQTVRDAARAKGIIFLNQELQQLTDKKERYFKKIQLLEDEITKYQIKQERMDLSIRHFKSYIAELSTSARKFSYLEDKEQLDKLFLECKEKKLQIEKQKNQFLKKTDEAIAGIKLLRGKIQELELNALNSKDHPLRKFCYAPKVICDELEKIIRQQFTAFDEAYPRNQTVLVRCAIIEMQYKLNYLLIQHQNKLVKQDENLIAQHYYQFLCGWLYDLRSRLIDDLGSKEFFRMIDSICQQLCLDEAETRHAHQQQLFIYGDQLSNVEEQELFDIESRILLSSVQNFKNKLQRLGGREKEIIDCKQSGFELANFIQKQANKTGRDSKFYSVVLTKAADYLSLPKNDKLAADLRMLVEDPSEHSRCVPQKLAGLLLAFVGAVVVVGSVLSTIASFGGTSPLSCLGMSMGAKIAAIGVGSIGVGSAFYGGFLFFSHAKGCAGMKKHVNRFAEKRQCLPFYAANASHKTASEGPELSAPLLSPGITG